MEAPTKKGLIYLAAICLIVQPLKGFTQTLNRPQILFRIANYKKYYKSSDDIILLINNVSDKQILFTIGEESCSNGHWSFDILNLLAPNPLNANVIVYKKIKPHSSQRITIYYKKRHYLQASLSKKHGISLAGRFVLRYHGTDSYTPHAEEKIFSLEFKDSY